MDRQTSERKMRAFIAEWAAGAGVRRDARPSSALGRVA
jgi:hypothetical protein